MPPHAAATPRAGGLASRLAIAGAVWLAAAAGSVAQEPTALRFPAACTLGTDCFVQQLPDLAPGPAARDSVCGSATYDGHDGVDIRVLSLADMGRGVAVTAAAGGVVRAVRDAMEDRLVNDAAGKAALKGRECGNGAVVAQDDGTTAQYCHLRRGSVAVLPGDRVASGQRIGLIGASGLAAFPHVHLSLRRGERKLDPLTGRPLDAACAPAPRTTGLLGDSRDLVARDFTEVLALGVAGAAPRYDRLVIDGPPPAAVAADGATVGYAWVANLQAGDRVRLVVRTPAGAVLAGRTSEAAGTRKAVYMMTAGLRTPPAAGLWTVEATILRNGAAALARTSRVAVR